MELNVLILKLQRYSITVPIDALRCSFFWFLAAIFYPNGLLRRSPPPHGTQANITASLLLIVLGVYPSKERVMELTRIFKGAALPLSHWPLTFCSLPEKAERRLLNFFTPELHHQARLQLITKHLPPARRILDLGGSCGGIPEGALLYMGYPHEPEEVVIVDLPPQLQFSSYREATLSRPPLPVVHQHGRTTIRTVYTPMTDLSPFEPSSFDLVWSGQSIEHVSPEDAKRVFEAVARVLKPEGVFCLDTPNRRVSALLTRGGMLHPEHKIEYTAAELKKLAEDLGYQVSQMLGETVLPFSREIGRYCRAEARVGALVTESVDDGLSFFLCCKQDKRHLD